MSFLEHLNPVQRDAVRAVNGPVLIVAGAGSGKTRVLTYRAAYLIHLGVPPESVLALTFTNKAAGEMKGRIEGLVGPASRSIWMGTFHSLCARMLRVEGVHIGYERNFSIYDRDDSVALVKSIMGDIGIAQQQFSPAGILARISSAKNQMVGPAEYRKTVVDPAGERTLAVYEEYSRRLRRSNAMDFDDLLLTPLELFSRRPDILERYQHRFRYILVDEYQDTNRVQYRLINALARAHRNICVVGDDAQSIYAFRGADIRNILDFKKDYPDAAVFRLEQNYRSTATILAAAQSVIRNNRDQIPKNLWTDRGPGDPITVTSCDDDLDEGYRVVGRIEEDTRRKKLDLKDFAVLYRTNAQSRAIEDALRRSGIPYLIVGGVAFYKRKEIKDVLAYLRVLANPKDDESLLRIINVPPRGLGESTVEKLRSLASRRGGGLLEAASSPEVQGTLSGRSSTRLAAFAGLLRKFLNLKSTMSVSELAGALVDELGILQSLKEENTVEALERRGNVQELLAALTEFSAGRAHATLDDFLEEVSLVSDVDSAEFGRNAVTLMTLHAAKGLEFPVVFITGLEEGLFPLANAAAEPKELEEERRLFYVGLTRAMQTVYLSFAQTRFQYGERTYAVRSRFLDELDPEMVTTERAASGRGTHRHAALPLQRSTRVREEAPEPIDASPNYEDESQETPELRIGSRVMHESFGRGKVVALDGRGERARAIVEFDSVGKKHLMLKFAHLRSA